MAKRAIVKRSTIDSVRPTRIGCFTLHAVGLDVDGRPSFEEYQGVGDYIKRVHHASGFWLGDWLRYGERREDWRERLSQAQDALGLSEKTLKNVRAVAGSIEHPVRRDDLEFGIHEVVASMPAAEQSNWLQRAAEEGWTTREFRLEIRSSRRRKIIEGQAYLEGQYRVIYADYPWPYGDRPKSGSGAQQHFPGMPIEEGCRLPVEAHATPDAVMFFWVTQPYLYFCSDGVTPDPVRLIHAWGFTPKTGQVWDKVLPAGGNYVAVRHEHLIICTRGSCTPDHPVPMPPSVITERRDPMAIHSAKPDTFRKQIERMYDGPRLELFGRERQEGWTVFGNDASLWAREVGDQDAAGEGVGDRGEADGVSENVAI